MKTTAFDNQVENQWCPGCSNFGVLQAVKRALTTTGKQPRDVCIVSGIGQAAKLPHYMNCNFFNGLHGRAIPTATGIQVANPDLTTLVVTGDGDCYGEGGNHFLHVMRRNPDICILVHNNELYALTKGQASPTTPSGERRSLPAGPVTVRPLNMLAIAVLHDVGFVARGFAGDIDHLAFLLAEAIAHRGLAIVEVLQPCITWGGHSVKWYKDRVEKVEEDHDPKDRVGVLAMLTQDAPKTCVGVLYRGKRRPVFGQAFREQVFDGHLTDRPAFSESQLAKRLAGYRAAPR